MQFNHNDYPALSTLEATILESERAVIAGTFTEPVRPDEQGFFSCSNPDCGPKDRLSIWDFVTKAYRERNREIEYAVPCNGRAFNQSCGHGFKVKIKLEYKSV